jgi:hypothetical protein
VTGLRKSDCLVCGYTQNDSPCKIVKSGKSILLVEQCFTKNPTTNLPPLAERRDRRLSLRRYHAHLTHSIEKQAFPAMLLNQSVYRTIRNPDVLFVHKDSMTPRVLILSRCTNTSRLQRAPSNHSRPNHVTEKSGMSRLTRRQA